MEWVPSILAKPANMSPLEFRRTKRKIALWDNTLLNALEERKIINDRFWMHVGGWKLMTIEAIYIKKLKPQTNTLDK